MSLLVEVRASLSLRDRKEQMMLKVSKWVNTLVGTPIDYSMILTNM